MSSSGGNRKSMDDVLSSIRRIIGAEKKDGYDDLPEREPQEPLSLGTPIREGSVPLAEDHPPMRDSAGPGPRAAPAAPVAPPVASPVAQVGEGGESLPLTPNMRVDFSKLSDEGTTPTDALVEEEPVGRDAMAHDLAAEDEAVVIDEAALEEMIRRIVREELSVAPPPAATLDEGSMRRVVREELMGETGQNISRNVQKMIQAEVARLLREQG